MYVCTLENIYSVTSCSSHTVVAEGMKTLRNVTQSLLHAASQRWSTHQSCCVLDALMQSAAMHCMLDRQLFMQIYAYANNCVVLEFTLC